jgi:hypothetical protein
VQNIHTLHSTRINVAGSKPTNLNTHIGNRNQLTMNKNIYFYSMNGSKELIHLLSQGQSRSMVDSVIVWTGDDPVKFKILVGVVSGKSDPSIRSRASWALSYIAENHPHLLKPHWDVFIQVLINPKTPDPIKRNLVRFMQAVDIPEKHHGKLVHRCFELVNNVKEDIAIRAFSLTVLANLVDVYPDMGHELTLSIEDLLPHASSGLKNRALKILKRLEKSPK